MGESNAGVEKAQKKSTKQAGGLGRARKTGHSDGKTHW